MFSRGDILVIVCSASNRFSRCQLLLCYLQLCLSCSPPLPMHSLPCSRVVNSITHLLSLFQQFLSHPPRSTAHPMLLSPGSTSTSILSPPSILSISLFVILAFSPSVRFFARQRQWGVCLWERQTDCVNCQRYTHLLFMPMKYQGAVCEACA